MQFGEQWLGQTVDGRFPLQKYLDGSPTSAVFLTHIAGDQNAKAVIKLVLASSCDADAQLSLWRRAGKLSHPNLIRILDGGRCWLAGNELIFLVTEYADENLGEVLSRRALTAQEGETLLRPLIAVLNYLHQQGLVHGHLRPSNVMAANEQLKISSDCIRPAGEIHSSVHTSAYDAPELKQGKLLSASDVWSLGVILKESLTGKDTPQDAAHKSLPKPFAEIVRHSLREDIGSRWTLQQIEACLRDDHVAAPQSTVPSSEIRPNIRRYLPVILAGILLLILAAIYGMFRSGAGQTTSGTASNAPAISNSNPESSAPISSVNSANGANSAGAVLQEVAPGASKNALKTVHGRLKVRVRVEVDPSGNVTGAQFITPGPSKYFSRLAMQAAQQWKFTAPKQNGQPQPSQWTVLFEYTRGGVSQQASQAAR